MHGKFGSLRFKKFFDVLFLCLEESWLLKHSFARTRWQSRRLGTRCGKTAVVGQRSLFARVNEERFARLNSQVEQEHQAVLQDMERVRPKLILGHRNS